MAQAEWSDEELTEAVEAYARMMDMTSRGETFNKAAIYRELAERFGRSPGAFERRMMNISALLNLNGKQWLPGLVPASNVGAQVTPRLENALVRAGVLTESALERNARLAGRPVAAWPMPFPKSSQRKANLLLASERASPKLRSEVPPPGVMNPREIAPTTKTFARDEAVRAWVLQRANGRCECCGRPAPFEDMSGVGFLEVHHLRQLAHSGSDRHTNAVAVCPNCHRELHHGKHADKLRAHLVRDGFGAGAGVTRRAPIPKAAEAEPGSPHVSLTVPWLDQPKAAKAVKPVPYPLVHRDQTSREPARKCYVAKTSGISPASAERNDSAKPSPADLQSL